MSDSNKGLQNAAADLARTMYYVMHCTMIHTMHMEHWQMLSTPDLKCKASVIFCVFDLPNLRCGVHMTRNMMPAYLIPHAR